MLKNAVLLLSIVCTLLVFDALAQTPQPSLDRLSTLADQVEFSTLQLQSSAVYTVGINKATLTPFSGLGIGFITNTFTSTIELTVTPLTITQGLEDYRSFNLFYELSAVRDNEAVQPNGQYIVVAFFDPNLLPFGTNIEDVALYYQNERGQWLKERTSKVFQNDKGNYYVGAYPEHFSTWGVLLRTHYVNHLPVIYDNYCAKPFGYTESADYNMVKINARTVWDATDCESLGRNVTVAVIDTGVDLQHAEFQGRLVAGRSFVAGVSSPDDDQGHGTHVAGIIAAASNNDGVMGVAPQAKIMPIKVLSADGYGSIADIAAGIIWAAENGADIINMSLGGTSNEQAQLDAVNYAYARGALIVAASGNCGDATYIYGFPSYWWNGCNELDETFYPAAYNSVMAVASTDQTDGQSIFSTQGYYVEVAAPGTDIISSFPYNLTSDFAFGYSKASGTSQAAPHVAGAAAVLLSRNYRLTNQDLRDILKYTAADVVYSGWDIQSGYGRIDLAAALDVGRIDARTTAITNPATVDTPTPPDVPFVEGELLIKRKPGVSLEQVMQAAHIQARSVQVASNLSAIQMERLVVPVGQEKAYAQQLEATGLVEYASLNYLMHMQ